MSSDPCHLEGLRNKEGLRGLCHGLSPCRWCRGLTPAMALKRNWFVMASATGERPVATTCGLVHRRGALKKKLTVDICWYSQKGRETFWDLSCWYFGVLDVHFTGQLWRRVRFLWLSSFHPCSRNSELLLSAWKEDHCLWMSGLHSS